MKFNYKWRLDDAEFAKDKGTGVVVTIKFLSCYFRVLHPLCYRRGFFICNFILNKNILKIWQKNDKKNSLKFGGL